MHRSRRSNRERTRDRRRLETGQFDHPTPMHCGQSYRLHRRSTSCGLHCCKPITCTYSNKAPTISAAARREHKRRKVTTRQSSESFGVRLVALLAFLALTCVEAVRHTRSTPKTTAIFEPRILTHSEEPTVEPTEEPTAGEVEFLEPTAEPTPEATEELTEDELTAKPTLEPSKDPSENSNRQPSPTADPIEKPTSTLTECGGACRDFASEWWDRCRGKCHSDDQGCWKDCDKNSGLKYWWCMNEASDYERESNGIFCGQVKKPRPDPTLEPSPEPTLEPTEDKDPVSGNDLESELNFVGQCFWNLCGRCSGDCDNDDECAKGFVCFQRIGGDASEVPGCAGKARDNVDYCIDEKHVTGKPTKRPTPIPSSKVPAPTMPTGSTELTVVYDPGDDNMSLLGKCEGDCDDDAECSEDLKCMKRTDGRLKAVVGCNGVGKSGVDYCYDPKDISPTLRPTRRPSPRPSLKPSPRPSRQPTMPTGSSKLTEVGNDLGPGILGRCEGDCDADAECQSGLVCLKRTDGRLKEVPGCIGEGATGTDYCFDPNDVAPTRRPTPRPSPPPTMPTGSSELTVVGDELGLGRLGKCEGDCDTTGDCQPGLLCYKRTDGRLTEVPGCKGEGDAGRDYCYDPKDVPPTPRPSHKPSPRPSRTPTLVPTRTLTLNPTVIRGNPTANPTRNPTLWPSTQNPTFTPTQLTPQLTPTPPPKTVEREEVWVALSPFVLNLTFPSVSRKRMLTGTETGGSTFIHVGQSQLQSIVGTFPVPDKSELQSIVGTLLDGKFRSIYPNFRGILIRSKLRSETRVEDSTALTYDFEGNALFEDDPNLPLPGSRDVRSVTNNALHAETLVNALRQSKDPNLQAVQNVALAWSDGEAFVSAAIEDENTVDDNGKNPALILKYAAIGLVAFAGTVLAGIAIIWHRNKKRSAPIGQINGRGSENNAKSAPLPIFSVGWTFVEKSKEALGKLSPHNTAATKEVVHSPNVGISNTFEATFDDLNVSDIPPDIEGSDLGLSTSDWSVGNVGQSIQARSVQVREYNDASTNDSSYDLSNSIVEQGTYTRTAMVVPGYENEIDESLGETGTRTSDGMSTLEDARVKSILEKYAANTSDARVSGSRNKHGNAKPLDFLEKWKKSPRDGAKEPSIEDQAMGISLSDTRAAMAAFSYSHEPSQENAMYVSYDGIPTKGAAPATLTQDPSLQTPQINNTKSPRKDRLQDYDFAWKTESSISSEGSGGKAVSSSALDDRETVMEVISEADSDLETASASQIIADALAVPVLLPPMKNEDGEESVGGVFDKTSGLFDAGTNTTENETTSSLPPEKTRFVKAPQDPENEVPAVGDREARIADVIDL